MMTYVIDKKISPSLEYSENEEMVAFKYPGV
jgi:hypothetical protein